MFRLKNDKLKTFYGFNDKRSRNDLIFFKNRMTYKKLNIKMNEKDIICKNTLNNKLGRPYINSLNNIKESKRVLSLNNSPQMSLRNIFKENSINSIHYNIRKEKNINTERKENLFSLTRNNTFSHIKKNFKNNSNNKKIKKTNFSIFDYNNNIYFNKTFYQIKNTDFKDSDYSLKLYLGERSNLYDKFNKEKYFPSDLSNKIKIIKKLRNETNIFPHHQKFLSIIKKKEKK